MREQNIVHERGDFWVYADADRYTVLRNAATHAVTDSTYPLDGDGLSLAIVRCDYLAKRARAEVPE